MRIYDIEQVKRKQYMLLISYGEEESYIYDSIDEMLSHWCVSSIEELINNESRYFSTAYVFEITKEWRLKDD